MMPGFAWAVALSALAVLLPPSSASAGWDEAAAAWQRHDWAAAEAELRPLAADGNPAAMARLGQILFLGLSGGRDDAEAVRLLTAAAEAGQPLAQHWLGTACLFGRGVTKSVPAALGWFHRAAAKGYPDSLHALGEVYFNGVGVPRDEAKGVGYFRRAAEKGLPVSLEKMAELRWNGRAMPTDRVQAVADARAAAAAGRAQAQFILGVAALTGEGAARDPIDAARWFRRAADRGHAQSAHNLGAMLAAGKGIAQDVAEGYFWLAVAARRATPNLRTGYERERDAIAARLPASDLERENDRLARWGPLKPTGDGELGGPAEESVPAPAGTETRPLGAAEPQPPRGRVMTGSGILISADGTVLTNAHVVERCSALTVTAGDGLPVAAVLRVSNRADDLAALITPLRGDYARFRAGAPLRSGDEVVVVGYPLSSLLSREANVTAGVISAMAGLRGDKRAYQITAPVQKGNSGGPLVDMTGALVGVVSSKLNAMKVAGQTGDLPQNINFAIKAEVARRFLDGNGIRYDTVPAGPALSVADVGERIKPATVFIQCKLDAGG